MGHQKNQDCPNNNNNNNNILSNEPRNQKSHKNKLGKFRRKHNKSRIGCSSCKERKIKCDQRLPFCVNCVKRGVRCPYLSMTPYQIHNLLEVQKKHGKFKIPNKNKNENKNSKLKSPDKSKNEYDSEEDEYFYHNYNNEKINIKNNNYNNGYNNDNQMNINQCIYQRSNPSKSTCEDSQTDCTTITQIQETEGLIISSVLNKIEPTKTLHKNTTSNGLNNKSKSNKGIPLYHNYRISETKFDITNGIALTKFIEFTKVHESILTLLMERDFKELIRLLNDKYLDSTIFYNYLIFSSFSQIYNKLLRNSLLLLAMDYYKNILLKQNILPLASYRIKLAISNELDKSSVILLDSITRIIKNEYLTYVDDFGIGSENLFLASLIILDDCLSYHFKAGLKFEMNFKECTKAMKSAGIFTTGMFAVIMERSQNNILMTSSNILLSYLITNFKKLLIPCYNIRIFEDFKVAIDKLFTFYHTDVNYENLRIFTNKYFELLKFNVHDNILGFDSNFIFKFYNSFKSILPFDLSNCLNETIDLSETDIIIRLAYYTLNQLINSFIPGIKIFLAGTFLDAEFCIYNFKYTQILMNLFKKINNKKLQLAAIFFIRMERFLNFRWICYKNFLFNFQLETLLIDGRIISTQQRYLRLRECKEEGIMDEIQIRSFSFERGQFIKKWNYPNKSHLKPTRSDKVFANKISNYFEND